MVIWDITGQFKFKSIRKRLYEGLEGLLLIFDLTYSKSFESFKAWFEDVKKNSKKGGEIKGFLIGNKVDLSEQRIVNKSEAESLSHELNLEYFETSALSGENINSSFERLAEKLLKKNLRV